MSKPKYSIGDRVEWVWPHTPVITCEGTVRKIVTRKDGRFLYVCKGWEGVVPEALIVEAKR